MANVNTDILLAALADPMRRQIIDHLRAGPSAVRPLADMLPISRPAVSQHLKVLSDAGLLHVRKDGNRRLYSLCPDAVAELRNYLDGLWTDAFDRFADAAKSRGET